MEWSGKPDKYKLKKKKIQKAAKWQLPIKYPIIHHCHSSCPRCSIKNTNGEKQGHLKVSETESIFLLVKKKFKNTPCNKKYFCISGGHDLIKQIPDFSKDKESGGLI